MRNTPRFLQVLIIAFLTLFLILNQARACPPCIPVGAAILESVGGSAIIGGSSVGAWASAAIGVGGLSALALHFTGEDVAVQYSADPFFAGDMEKMMADLASAGYQIIRNNNGVVITILIWENTTSDTYIYSLLSHQWERVKPNGEQISPALDQIPDCIKATIKPMMTSLSDWKNSLSEIRVALESAKRGIATVEQIRRLYMFGDLSRTCADDMQCTQLRKEVRGWIIYNDNFILLEYELGFQPAGLTDLNLEMTSEELEYLLDSLNLSKKALRIQQRRADDLEVLNGIPTELGFDGHKIMILERLCRQGFKKACIIVKAVRALRLQEIEEERAKDGVINDQSVSLKLYKLCRAKKITTVQQLYEVGRTGLSSRPINENLRKEIKEFLEKYGFDFRKWMDVSKK